MSRTFYLNMTFYSDICAKGVFFFHLQSQKIDSVPVQFRQIFGEQQNKIRYGKRNFSMQ